MREQSTQDLHEKDPEIPLAMLIQSLREQLAQAASAASESPRFKVDKIEVELTVVARRELEGGGKLKFSVLSLGAELGGAGKHVSEGTQRVRLSLTPIADAPQHRDNESEGHLLIARGG